MRTLATIALALALCLSGSISGAPTSAPEKPKAETIMQKEPLSGQKEKKPKKGGCIDRIHKQQNDMTNELGKIKDLLSENRTKRKCDGERCLQIKD